MCLVKIHFCDTIPIMVRDRGNSFLSFCKCLHPFVREFIVVVAITAALVIPLRTFVLKPFLVFGASMYPSFSTGDYVIIDRITYSFREPMRGDVIIFEHPKEDILLIKRIIGLPHEVVTLSPGSILIKKGGDEEFVLEESYIFEDGTGIAVREVFELKGNEYVVLGDNRTNSMDSRVWGALDGDNILGRVFVRLLPLDEVALFPADTTY